jgi:hypothetical protein
MTKTEYFSLIAVSTIIIFLPILGSLVIFDIGIKCKTIDLFNGEDKYCYHIPIYTNNNYTPIYSQREYFGWEMRSHSQDLIEKNKREEEERIRLEKQEKERDCFNKGQDYFFSYDIIKDYNLTCKKIEYINNNLIDEKINGGYIDGRYDGFFSHGKISGSFDLIKKSLAVGKLVKENNYHLDCNGLKSNEEIKYYEESDFVMYYVERCLK